MESVLLFALGAIVGLGLPDIDAVLSFLTHRSIITHNPFWPLLPLWAAKTSINRARLFSMGLSISLAVHFCFDLFPRSWRGYALVHLPLLGRVGGVVSWVWLAVSALVCVYIAARLIQRLLDVVFVVGGGAISFGIMATSEPFTGPLVAFLLAVVLAVGTDWKRLSIVSQKSLEG